MPLLLLLTYSRWLLVSLISNAISYITFSYAKGQTEVNQRSMSYNTTSTYPPWVKPQHFLQMISLWHTVHVLVDIFNFLTVLQGQILCHSRVLIKSTREEYRPSFTYSEWSNCGFTILVEAGIWYGQVWYIGVNAFLLWWMLDEVLQCLNPKSNIFFIF